MLSSLSMILAAPCLARPQLLGAAAARLARRRRLPAAERGGTPRHRRHQIACGAYFAEKNHPAAPCPAAAPRHASPGGGTPYLARRRRLCPAAAVPSLAWWRWRYKPGSGGAVPRLAAVRALQCGPTAAAPHFARMFHASPGGSGSMPRPERLHGGGDSTPPWHHRQKAHQQKSTLSSTESTLSLDINRV